MLACMMFYPSSLYLSFSFTFFKRLQQKVNLWVQCKSNQIKSCSQTNLTILVWNLHRRRSCIKRCTNRSFTESDTVLHGFWVPHLLHMLLCCTSSGIHSLPQRGPPLPYHRSAWPHLAWEAVPPAWKTCSLEASNFLETQPGRVKSRTLHKEIPDLSKKTNVDTFKKSWTHLKLNHEQSFLVRISVQRHALILNALQVIMFYYFTFKEEENLCHYIIYKLSDLALETKVVYTWRWADDKCSVV